MGRSSQWRDAANAWLAAPTFLPDLGSITKAFKITTAHRGKNENRSGGSPRAFMIESILNAFKFIKISAQTDFSQLLAIGLRLDCELR